MLGLEVVGAVAEVGDEEPPASKLPPLQTMRASHHAIARLDAKGLSAAEISAQTGVSLIRVYTLRECPSYRGLVAHYSRDADHVAEMVEAQLLIVAKDYMQHIHEKVLDTPKDVSLKEANEVVKTMLDRAGYSPVQHTVNKNLNLNVATRLDEARRRKLEAMDD